MKLLITISLITLFTLFSGCSTRELVKTHNDMPVKYIEAQDKNETKQIKQDLTLSLFRLSNYTDTPRAGMRAGNILGGILLTKGFDVTNHVNQIVPTKKEAREIALKDGSKYFMYGGVSEWRYKTGIDGEPAVSIVCSLYKTKNSQLVWSATGSDSDWGNGSVGVIAQDLLEQMLEN